MEEGIDPEDIFNTKGFLRKVDEDNKPFLKAICRTQLFHHFVHDAYEYDDDYEVRVFKEAMKLKPALDEYLEPYLLKQLSPENWETQKVDVTPCNMEGMPEGYVLLE